MNLKETPKTPQLISQATGLPLDVARFIHAIEAGEIEGDCIEIDKGSQESQKAEP